eukprot:TRINITY_DN124145_c0_g1_i1.p1 TRINITY_DN124145_c0_g1~~TRINITY_DN124145_c0_g1_i1.p1  ORF type:complete len:119 (-),score=26.32 TRINITY_DN124145_c0_g1_i1:35-391(-)
MHKADTNMDDKESTPLMATFGTETWPSFSGARALFIMLPNIAERRKHQTAHGNHSVKAGPRMTTTTAQAELDISDALLPLLMKPYKPPKKTATPYTQTATLATNGLTAISTTDSKKQY